MTANDETANDETANDDLERIARFARLALDCVHREYPSQVSHLMRSDDDARPPRSLTPVFFGCFDWHSAVHGHWLLARAARRLSDRPVAERARRALERRITPHHVTLEWRYMEPRPAFERPYGLSWLLALDAELRAAEAPSMHRLAHTLGPLVRLAADRLTEWLPKLPRPIRSGTHSQTAFSMTLMLDWARARGDDEAQRLLVEHARRFHLDDRDYPLHLEPSGEDFVSPSLGAADLMRRVLAPDELARWLERVLPGLPHDGRADWLAPIPSPDRADGRLAHLDGLSLSRAWMLEGVAASLPPDDDRIAALRAAGAAHREAGLAAVSSTHYEGAHWLGTFATYLVSGPVAAA